MKTKELTAEQLKAIEDTIYHWLKDDVFWPMDDLNATTKNYILSHINIKTKYLTKLIKDGVTFRGSVQQAREELIKEEKKCKKSKRSS